MSKDDKTRKSRSKGIRSAQAANARKREQTALEMRKAGCQFAEIGRALGGVTATRARHLYLRAVKRLTAE